MIELLLPYANDINGKLTHIDNAQKGQKYTCPNCGEEVLLKISRIPKWEKYHKRNHFAHKVKVDNESRCSESVLHKQFKEKCSEIISAKITEKQELYFVWRCKRCKQIQKDNLLNNVVAVVTEYNLGECRPDIALLDSEGKVLMVIEIVLSHSPEEKSLKYYEENNIVCIKVRVSKFEECDEIKKVLVDSDKIEIYPARECAECDEEVKTTRKRVNQSYRVKENSILGGKSADSLEERANKVICEDCGGKMEIAVNEFGGQFLRCQNHPKCNFRKSVDTLLWPELFNR